MKTENHMSWIQYHIHFKIQTWRSPKLYKVWCPHIHTHMCTHTCMHTHACMHTCTRTHIYSCNLIFYMMDYDKSHPKTANKLKIKCICTQIYGVLFLKVSTTSASTLKLNFQSLFFILATSLYEVNKLNIICYQFQVLRQIY